VGKAIYSLYFVDDRLGFGSGQDGAVIRTMDGGDNWDVLTSVTTEPLLSVRFATRDIGWVVGGRGVILRTSNGGGPLPPPPPPVPADIELQQNFPNPFNNATTIRYRFTRGPTQHVSLQVFNILGQRITTLVDEVQVSNPSSVPEYYTRTFDAGSLASGIYFVRLRVGDFQGIRKMIIVR
jgi:hypothetical protein